jgi:hypothetical protein
MAELNDSDSSSDSSSDAEIERAPHYYITCVFVWNEQKPGSGPIYTHTGIFNNDVSAQIEIINELKYYKIDSAEFEDDWVSWEDMNIGFTGYYRDVDKSDISLFTSVLYI